MIKLLLFDLGETPRRHYSDIAQARNAEAFTRYLATRDAISDSGKQVLFDSPVNPTADATIMHEHAKRRLDTALERHGWKDAAIRFPIGAEYSGTVRGKSGFGVFVGITNGPTGLLQINDLPTSSSLADFNKGDGVRVIIEDVDEVGQKMRLRVSPAYS